MESNFIDELLLEVEAKEEKLLLSHVDQVIKEIGEKQKEIERTLNQAEEEKQLIQDWALSKCDKIQNKIDWMTKKLESFMNEQGDAKTIDLPNGALKKRQTPDRIEVTDLEAFLKNKQLERLTTVQPEVIKPDLNKIKFFYKETTKLPKGTELIKGQVKFSVKIKTGENKNG